MPSFKLACFRALAAVSVAGVLLVSSVASAQAPDARNKPAPWPHAFPIWGNKLSERGIKFPLPFGVGINYAYINQPIEITRIAVGVNDSELVDLSDLIQFGDISSTVHAFNARVDLWLLPFLNVYGMGNYVVQSETAVSVVEPFALNAGATQPGGGGGFGTTLAGGAWGFFGTLDLNWTWNKMEKLDAPVGTFLVTPRVGKNFGKVFGIETILWVGAMHQKIQAKTTGAISLDETLSGGGSEFEEKIANWYQGLPPLRQAAVRGLVGRLDQPDDVVIRYNLDKAVAKPWNMTVGGELGITEAWRVRAEVGFIGRTQVIVGINYRFGDFMGTPEPPAPIQHKRKAVVAIPAQVNEQEEAAAPRADTSSAESQSEPPPGAPEVVVEDLATESAVEPASDPAPSVSPTVQPSPETKEAVQ